jgi:hypothetical protein
LGKRQQVTINIIKESNWHYMLVGSDAGVVSGKEDYFLG